MLPRLSTSSLTISLDLEFDLSMALNLELKVSLVNRDETRIIAERLGAVDSGELIQTDTYFMVADGRLKLRESGDGKGELIFYRRPENDSERWSSYQIYPAPDAEKLRALLADSLGVKTIVKKSRILFLWKNARIHLDRVEALGDFLEFEVVVTDGEEQAERVMKELRDYFGIEEKDIIRCSYADL